MMVKDTPLEKARYTFTAFYNSTVSGNLTLDHSLSASLGEKDESDLLHTIMQKSINSELTNTDYEKFMMAFIKGRMHGWIKGVWVR